MSNVGTLTFRLIRTYASKSFTQAAGIQGKLEKLDLPDDREEIDNEDLDAYTSDFMNIRESHKMHEREIEKSKEKLKQRIVKSKYFKETEPKFLTFREKDQIQKLHESNPLEWTPEKLSNSFPALPETIRSVLKAKWVPKSIDRIIKFDTEVVNNWKNFKSGRLVVNPILREHLMKFKDRKIALPNKEDSSKTLVPPKMEFLKPRSSLFSSILTKSANEKQPVQDQKLISSESEINRNKQILCTINRNDLEKSMVQVNSSDYMKINKRKSVANEKILTFNEFMKVQLKQLYKKSPEEGITLLQTYRKYIESMNLGVVESKESTNSVEQVKKENITPTKSVLTENVPVVEKNETQTKVVNTLNTERGGAVDTYVKDRKTDIDTKFEYTKPIKIPKNVWKQGLTYRVKDCYYDDDGEFLYRVPGLRL
ncbi:uncharacterized protein LOC143356111 [Halictus rubicundus]|uniref:uncharacterized protein LOC143356111 n=1 Tax=Halictus rubicundus TaxID=77578 RepID=UPI0040358629